MAQAIDSEAAHDFALETVRRLRDAGFEAYWAGGCVRDRLMGNVPKDYDIATGAQPEQVRQVFGRRHTYAIGAAFGVINLCGPQRAGQIEIATFREDLEYSDGRHPDGVKFSTAEADAQRRDFTINGLFFDPIDERVIDYVEGQKDIQAKVIRAIGNPDDRIAEDKLRMLRAVRFAARFEFEIAAETSASIRNNASRLNQVSRERVTSEVSAMLLNRHRERALRLLQQLDLLDQVSQAPIRFSQTEEAFPTLLQLVGGLDSPSLSQSIACWLWPFRPSGRIGDEFCRAWKLTNEETKQITWILEHEAALREAAERPWPEIQRLLISPHARKALEVAIAVESVIGNQETQREDFDRRRASDGTNLCRERLEWEADRLDPPPLINGDDLVQLGLQPGKQFKIWLDAIRDKQLEGELSTRDQAVRYLQEELMR